MRTSTFFRAAAALGAGALVVAVPATASAQSQNPNPTGDLQAASSVLEAAPQSVADLGGGALASLGLGDLGSAAAGGRCVALSPAFGSAASTLDVTAASKPGTPGVAEMVVDASSWFGQTSGTVHWTNETTGEKGDVPFGPLAGDNLSAYKDVATGAGHVTWSVDATVGGAPLSVSLPLVLTGSVEPGSPLITAPFSTCTGAADIA